MKYYSISPPPSAGSQILLNEHNAMVNTLFDLSTDVYHINRELVFASASYVDTRVRVTSATNTLTGRFLGDDFKQLLFNPSDNIDIKIGNLYNFSDNYWLAIYSDAIKSIVSNGTIRRCNNMLKWIDENGVLYQEPAICDYESIGTRNLTRQDDMVLPQGTLKIFCQLNSRTEKIKPNQRFLFGRPNQQVCLRVLGNGEMNAQMQATLDNTSSTLLTLTVDAYQVNPDTDDLVNGIADAYKLVYSISLSASQISGNITESYPINATLLCNNLPTTGSLTYATSSSTIATINTSGSITLNASGSTTITSYMGGNPTVSASATIIVTASGTTTNEIRVLPSDNIEILESDTTLFTTYLYSNGVAQSDTFTFAPANTNVPTDHYILIANNNGFSLENVERYLDWPLLITATSGSYTKQISITLNGAF